MATLNSATPALPVKTLDASAPFYRDKLGFEIVHRDGGFAIVERDAVAIILWEANDPNTPGAEPFIAGTASCRIQVTGIRELYAECQAQGVIHPNGPLQRKPWGVDDFSVLDPDSNLITFEEDAEQ